MRVMLVMVLAIFGLANVASAQHGHSDIVFGYNDLTTPTGVEIENDNVTSEGFQFFEAGFSDAIISGDFNTDDPGFTTEAADNLLFGSGDRVFITAVDASLHSSFGQGFVTYFDPSDSSLTAAGSIEIEGAIDTATLNAGSASGTLSQLIDVADAGGDIHSHVEFDLLNDAASPAGAYGVMFQIDVDRNIGGGPDGTIDISSDKFWILFNKQLDEDTFEDGAVVAFGGPAAVPEPTGLLALSAIGMLGFLRRRNRRS